MMIKKFGINLLFTAFLFTLSAPALSATKINQDYQDVAHTAYRYFEGAAKGDQTLLANSFDLEFGHVKMIRQDKKSGEETIRTMPLSEFAKVFKQATTDEWQANILSIDVVNGKMANVKLQFDTSKTQYIDYLVMYKRNQQWRIINKTFVATNKN